MHRLQITNPKQNEKECRLLDIDVFPIPLESVHWSILGVIKLIFRPWPGKGTDQVRWRPMDTNVLNLWTKETEHCDTLVPICLVFRKFLLWTRRER